MDRTPIREVTSPEIGGAAQLSPSKQNPEEFWLDSVLLTHQLLQRLHTRLLMHLHRDRRPHVEPHQHYHSHVVLHSPFVFTTLPAAVHSGYCSPTGRTYTLQTCNKTTERFPGNDVMVGRKCIISMNFNKLVFGFSLCICERGWRRNPGPSVPEHQRLLSVNGCFRTEDPDGGASGLQRPAADSQQRNHRRDYRRDHQTHELPGLLSTMWQTLGQHPSSSDRYAPSSSDRYAPSSSDRYAPSSSDRYAPSSSDRYAPSSSDRYAPSSHQGHTVSGLEAGFSAQAVLQLQEDMSGSWGAMGSDDEELLDHMGEEAPLCSQTDMEELRRSCSESQCIAGHANGQVSQVEVYPGSGVLCDVRSWQAANQAPSPTAMARMLLLGVFDMDTLMNSNLRGGRSRRPASHSQRSALDPHKINAIFNAILARFPLAKRGVIGSGINSKLSEIRFRSRRANPDMRFL